MPPENFFVIPFQEGSNA
uniref:Uncharacterized protein n=1 Tax=Rhizophora mucronata TaxID=61149 RepID=A0A2P2PZ91_RHIMU